ncbi:unnamed protein product [Cuscuta campestris]|uniref:Uncharacterized protein n=1 Tax=Cuscuta campestris TaxID=132261 RepID=A0A484KE02_9ASTE|nr:unnamed protein product [Cuscuta campestris]
MYPDVFLKLCTVIREGLHWCHRWHSYSCNGQRSSRSSHDSKMLNDALCRRNGLKVPKGRKIFFSLTMDLRIDNNF